MFSGLAKCGTLASLNLLPALLTLYHPGLVHGEQDHVPLVPTDQLDVWRACDGHEDATIAPARRTRMDTTNPIRPRGRYERPA